MAQFANPSQRLGVVSQFFLSMWQATRDQIELEARLGKIRRMHGLSDEALAKVGVERDEIVRYVFKDHYYV